jgi:hypothetical protein
MARFEFDFPRFLARPCGTMKLCLRFLLLLTAIISVSALGQEAPVKRSGKFYMQVYFQENFKGKAVRVEVPCELNNDARLKEVGIANDSIQSMKIPDGFTVTLYANAGFGGESAAFTGKAATLGNLKGQASSLKAEQK